MSSADNTETDESDAQARSVATDRKTHSVTTEVGVPVSADTWARIYGQTKIEIERGEDPEIAWRDAVNEYIHAVAVPMLEGQGERRIEDVLAGISDVEAKDEDENHEQKSARN